MLLQNYKYLVLVRFLAVSVHNCFCAFFDYACWRQVTLGRRCVAIQDIIFCLRKTLWTFHYYMFCVILYL